ncbi:hypothetical protein MBCUT_20050 [Methanobrevibacter cuticularis]|uniref:Uncharacterized protein n=1 Tax=Methanobrevibacter cuticularis TaxID=47311 RepID=A0A166CKT8_9EURY|nr:hypothetical protein [Methanobrevibacter cuticularis]KZX14615.1 hypothetical protein MBCUT_20050 [Methanobrevibacter cuticularis]
MPKILKAILIILLFIGFFEAGLLSSYTIITSEAPDVKGLIDLQIEIISGIFSPENIDSILLKDPNQINITNMADVADKITSLAKVDGVDLNNTTITTYNSQNDEKLDVNITALCYSSPNATKGQIILSQIPDYEVKASASAVRTDSGIEVNVTTIKIISILKLYNQ